MQIELDEREHATVMAALRMWQRLGLTADEAGPEDYIASNGGTLSLMQPTEIDALCERINFEDEPDNSSVMDRLENEHESEVSSKSRWHFMPDNDAAPDLFFETEDEACAAQQGWRIAKGLDAMSGLKKGAE